MPENKSSFMLTTEENESIFSLLGYKCQSLATTVIELYVAGGRLAFEDWMKKDMGVLCLVKDNNKRSYFFRLYCPLRRRMLWEHEVYNDMKYITPSPYLHTFEAEDCIVGFNFASEEEGDFLNSILLAKLENKRQRRQEKRNRSSMVFENSNSIGVNNNNKKATSNRSSGSIVPLPNWSAELPSAPYWRQKKRHGKLSKADIGTPKDFRHISHVGFDADRGFDVSLNPSLKEFLSKAGISERQLRDPETMGFIYDFIERNGGMEAVKTEVGPAPPIPERNTRARAPPPPPPPTAPPPAPVNPPPPPPIRTYPPRVPPSSTAAQPPPPPPMSGLSSGGPAPVAPPMPPPPPSIPPPLDSGPPSFNSGASSDPHSALMQAIKDGTSLKPVTERVIEPCEKKSSQDSRGRLMEEIRDFKSTKLNTVQLAAESGTRRAPEGGLAGALAEALAKRAKVIQSESSSGSSGGEDDDEWED